MTGIVKRTFHHSDHNCYIETGRVNKESAVIRHFLQSMFLAAIFSVFTLMSMDVHPENVHFNFHKAIHHNFSKKFFTSPFTGLPVMANGRTALPSNANNFHGGWNAFVDPRTGSASFSLITGTMVYNLGRNRRNLTLSYTGGSSAMGPDPFGIGPHWSWNTGMESESPYSVNGQITSELTTGDGHSFTMVKEHKNTGQNVWHPLRHKLQDVRITGHPGNWTIAMATGVQEHFEQGYETWEEDRQGRKLWLYYDRNDKNGATRHLVYICAHQIKSSEIPKPRNACAGAGIWITYTAHSVTVHGQQMLTLHLAHIGGFTRIASITMPSLSSKGISNHSTPASLQFYYDDIRNRPWLLHDIQYPDGTENTFLYNEETSRSDARTQGLPTGINGARIPVVTEQVTLPASRNIRAKHIWYYYGTNKNQHNYTGYMGNNTLVPGKDNLMDRSDDYTYSVTQDDGQISTTTTYNKYHLPLKIIQKNDLQNMLIGENMQVYPPWKHTTFNALPANYSLAIQSIKRLYTMTESGVTPGTSTKIIQEERYNNKGQVIWQKDAAGRETFIQYCPEKGDKRCPPVRSSFPEFGHPEKVLKLPADNPHASGRPAFSEEMPHALEIIFNYTQMPALNHYGQKNSKDSTRVLWKVKSRIFTTINSRQINGIHPGSILPEPSKQSSSTSTEYMYDNNENSDSYGELIRMSITKSPTPIAIMDHRIHLSHFADQHSNDKIVINISRNVDRNTNLRKNRTSIVNPEPSPQSLSDSPLGNTGTTAYSTISGEKVFATDTLGLIKESWSYDTWGRPVRKTVTPSGKFKPAITRWHYIVTKKEKAIVQTDPDGNQIKVETGSHNEVLSTWHRFSNQAYAPMEGNSNWIPDTAYTYTSMGKPASKTITTTAESDDKGLSPGTIRLTTRYGYDAMDRLTWTHHPDGLIDIRVYDDAARRIITYQASSANNSETLGKRLNISESSLMGKPVASYDLSLDPDTKKNGVPLYSPALRTRLKHLIEKLRPVSVLHTRNGFGLLPTQGSQGLMSFISAVLQAGAWLKKITITRDGNGRPIKQVSGNGTVTRWIWKNGSLIATISPDGRIIHDEFNLIGKKTVRCVQPDKDSQCLVLGSREYDSQGHLLWQKDETGKLSVRYTYDKDGRVTSMLTPAASPNQNGHLFTYTYNSMGITEERLDGKPRTIYTYDPVTWKLTDREDHVSHLHYEYDPTSQQLTKITYRAPVTLTPLPGIHYPEGQELFTWDRYKRPVTHTDFAGNRYKTGYDHFGRVNRIFVRLPGNPYDSLIKHTVFDVFGRPWQITNGAGVTRQFTYNVTGQVSSTTDSRNGKQFQKIFYTYDFETGNIITIKRQTETHSATRYYHYDINNNLKEMVCTTNDKINSGNLCPRETELKDSGIPTPPIITDQKYTFDKWNNISEITEKLDSNGKKITKDIRYIYEPEKNSNNDSTAFDPHRVRGIDIHWSGHRYSSSPRLFTYDTQGRVIRDPDGNLLHYNPAGHLSSFTNPHTHECIHYVYDSQEHQIAEQSFNEKSGISQPELYMHYTGNRVTSQIQKDRAGQMHVSAEIAGMAYSEDGKITHWYLHDYKGDVITIMNAHDKKIRDTVYSPYGMAYNIPAKTGSSFLPSTSFDRLWKFHQPGFDNQITDPVSGYQFPGGGYRAYSMTYRRFMSKDSDSPFKQIDGYGFVKNNPVMQDDPTGHTPRWVGFLIGALSIPVAISMAALVPVSVALAGASTSALAGAIMVSAVNGLLGVASGSLQIASTAHPELKTLSAINNETGVAQGVLGIMSVSNIEGMMLAVKYVSTSIGIFRHLLKTMIITTTSTNTLSWAVEGVASAISTAGYYKPSIEKHSEQALGILNYIFTGLASISFLASIATLAVSVSAPAIEKKILMSEFDENTGQMSTNKITSDADNRNITQNGLKKEFMEMHNTTKTGSTNGIIPAMQSISASQGSLNTLNINKELSGLTPLRRFSILTSFSRIIKNVMGINIGVERIYRELMGSGKGPVFSGASADSEITYDSKSENQRQM